MSHRELPRRRHDDRRACRYFGLVLLDVDRLELTFDTAAGPVRPVVDVTLGVSRGETLALVGESGSGKSLTALAVLQLLPPRCRLTAGNVRFAGEDLSQWSEKRLRAFRGNRVAMIFQEPMTSLNPLMTVGAQIEETLIVHRSPGSQMARARALGLLRQVGIPAPEQRYREYPHQLSGGMRQRVMIAMALACEPELLLADEPTTALDVTVQAQILALLQDLQRQMGLAMLFITHDLGVVSQIAHRVAVMYSGRIVETAPVSTLFTAPRHPYTQGLLRATPHLIESVLTGSPHTPFPSVASRHLPVIPGDVPEPRARPPGCAFHPRCPLGHTDERCRTQLPLSEQVAAGHWSACWLATGESPRNVTR
ncbi:MAG: ABC transporter ATP-binding protein [Phycisphaerales bacterium]|nr:ABC transporter ATP-binding protein [Phycisphaerales bacterium]